MPLLRTESQLQLEQEVQAEGMVVKHTLCGTRLVQQPEEQDADENEPDIPFPS